MCFVIAFRGACAWLGRCADCNTRSSFIQGRGGNSSLGTPEEAGNAVRLADFGISRLQSTDSSTSTTTTTSFNVQGTTQYTAPERWTGNTPSATPADIFSLGMLLLSIFTCNRPWPAARSAQEVMWKVAQGERPHIPDDCPEALAALIRSCWAQETSTRPSANQALVGLLAMMEPPPADPTEPVERKY